MLDQAEALRRMMAGNREDTKDETLNISSNKTKIITVTSGKGGVGKSNFVINLAILLSKKGKKVLVFDADIGMGNDDVLMGVFPKFSVFDILEGKEIEDIIEEGPEGIYLLAGGSGLNRIEDLSEEERNIFLDKIEGLNGFDYILMDTGAGINRSVLAFISCSEDLIILTTPEPTSLTDAYSLVKAAEHFGLKDKANIVVNKVFDLREGELTYNKFKKAVDKFLQFDVFYLGCILDDRKLIESVRSQIPVTINYPNSDASKSIKNICNKILGETENYTAKKYGGAKGLFSKIFEVFS